MARGNNKSDLRPVIIRRVKKSRVVAHRHSGAWKVAYADFTTAMMAFFMLLWLLTVSDKVTLHGIADYFTPSTATMSNSSGSGGILGGTAAETKGAKSAGSITVAMAAATAAANSDDDHSGQSSDKNDSGSNWEAKMPPQSIDSEMLWAEADIKTAIQQTSELSQYQDQLVLEQTPEGLRIHLTDVDQRPMFHSGKAEMYPFSVTLVRLIGGIVSHMPNRIAIQGHTDSAGGSSTQYSNWELSADRANAARRILSAASVSNDRIAEVTGKGSGDPLYPDNKNRAENRRITIILLREAPVVAPNFGAGSHFSKH